MLGVIFYLRGIYNFSRIIRDCLFCGEQARGLKLKGEKGKTWKVTNVDGKLCSENCDRIKFSVIVDLSLTVEEFFAFRMTFELFWFGMLKGFLDLKKNERFSKPYKF